MTKEEILISKVDTIKFYKKLLQLKKNNDSIAIDNDFKFFIKVFKNATKINIKKGDYWLNIKSYDNYAEYYTFTPFVNVEFINQICFLMEKNKDDKFLQYIWYVVEESLIEEKENE